jgi:serine protease Do
MMHVVRSPRTRYVAAAMALLVLAAGSFVAGLSGVLVADTVRSEAPAVSPADLEHAHSLSAAFRASSAHVLPAVVSIQNEVRPKMVRSDRPMQRGVPQLPPELGELDPLFKRFFEDMPEMGPGTQRFGTVPNIPQQSSGSGVIIDESGVILTNNHVVAGEGKVTVKLNDGRVFVAEEVLTDPSTDLAVVRINAGGALPVAKLGNSDAMQIGDWVLALGQPFGLEKTVTAGIISAKGRDIGINRHEEFLQTDAAINPGNSGGPLVNLQGEVIGINTAISSRSGGFEGIGFAVPVNVAKWVSSQLLKDGKVHRAYLGVGIQPVDSDLAGQLGLAASTGAIVTDVQPGSPAAAAGLAPQDVIVKFGETEIGNHRQLSAVVSRTPINKATPVVVMRDGKPVTLQVTVKEAPANYGVPVAAATEEAAPPAKSFSKLGLEVAPLSDEVASQLGLRDAGGVVVTGVEEGSLAERAGLEAGMAITQVGRQKVSSVEEFDVATGEADLEKGVLLLVRTAQGSRFVVLKGE